MLTKIEQGKDPRIKELDAILRSCVHCGFCNATCPTYNLFGSELEGPRGRIYLVKGMLEEKSSGKKTRTHLDRCLTCRSCETTCPSGVKYGRLIDISRSLLERSFFEKMVHGTLLAILPDTRRLSKAMRLARLFRPLLPSRIRSRIFPARKAEPITRSGHSRKMLILEGCVLPLASPDTNLSASRVLDRLGISLIPAPGCCGAMHQHMGAIDAAKQRMKKNIDAWWPHVESGIEAIVLTASGCGLEVKEYGEMLKDDPVYGEKAERISHLARDISEVLQNEDMSCFSGKGNGMKVAFHCSCSLQHGQELSGVVESLLARCGYRLTAVPDAHLCCGAAGTYFLLQPEISNKLLERKLEALQGGLPDVIATANVGCQLHLESGASIPVKHWIELLDQERK